MTTAITWSFNLFRNGCLFEFRARFRPCSFFAFLLLRLRSSRRLPFRLENWPFCRLQHFIVLNKHFFFSHLLRHPYFFLIMVFRSASSSIIKPIFFYFFFSFFFVVARRTERDFEKGKRHEDVNVLNDSQKNEKMRRINRNKSWAPLPPENETKEFEKQK